ncbi:MAG: succinyl-CoA--3-ketoacid-CoA transferase [Oscillospiraceae bacterium]|nr:succinyl-CoA--3-ketoacid-CoA transferase [Oscillospiraceae bacterium]
MISNRERIARKVALDIQDGEFVNFGFGIPYSIPPYFDKSKKIFFQNEPGVVCFGTHTPAENGYYEMLDAANRYVCELARGAFMDTPTSFAMIRGGHIGKTVLGALQVDSHANIANWKTPGMPATAIGGAMDLCAGCPQVLVTMESTTKTGAPKMVETCSYPLTAVGRVTMVYTELGVFTVNPKDGFTLIERFPDYSVDQILAKVDAPVAISPDLKIIDIGVPLD